MRGCLPRGNSDKMAMLCTHSRVDLLSPSPLVLLRPPQPHSQPEQRANMPFDLIVSVRAPRLPRFRPAAGPSRLPRAPPCPSQTGKFVPEKSNIWRDCVDGFYDWVKEHIEEVGSQKAAGGRQAARQPAFHMLTLHRASPMPAGRAPQRVRPLRRPAAAAGGWQRCVRWAADGAAALGPMYAAACQAAPAVPCHEPQPSCAACRPHNLLQAAAGGGSGHRTAQCGALGGGSAAPGAAG